MNIQSITTLKELKSSGYTSKSIKDELRDNLIQNLKNNINPNSVVILRINLKGKCINILITSVTKIINNSFISNNILQYCIIN